MTDKQHLNLLLDAVKQQLDKRDAAVRNTREYYMAQVAAKALFEQAVEIAKRINLKVAA